MSVIADRYLVGVVGLKGMIGATVLDPDMMPTKSGQAALAIVHDLLKRGSAWTPEVVLEEFTQVLGAGEAEQLLLDAGECNIKPAQVRELGVSLIQKYIQREGEHSLDLLRQRLDQPEAIDEILEHCRWLKSLQPTRSVSLGKQVAKSLEMAFSGGASLIPYGIPTLDRAVGGCSRGEITIVAARPGHGKTSFVCDRMNHWVKEGRKVVMFSKEMPAVRLLHKLLSNNTGISSTRITRGQLTEEEKEQITNSAKEYVEKFRETLIIHDDVYDTREMESIILRHKPDVVIDDFIQLSQMDDSNIRLEIMRIMKTYKRWVKEENFALITLSQLNRGIEGREDPRPRLSDLAESGALEQLAGDVIFLYYPHKVDITEPANRVEALASKTRYGTSAGVVLNFDGSTMRYRQLGVQQQEIVA